MKRNVARRIAMMPTAMKACPAAPQPDARKSLELRVGRRTERCREQVMKVELLDHEAEGDDDDAGASQARNVRSLAARSA